MFFRWYETGLRGEVPCVPAEGYKWSQMAALNQKIYEQYRRLPLPEVLEQFRDSHQKTVKLIESLSESDLFTPGLYAWMNQNNLCAYIQANTGSHYRWARKDLHWRWRRSFADGRRKRIYLNARTRTGDRRSG